MTRKQKHPPPPGSFAHELIAWREAEGLDRAGAAKFFGVSERTIENWELSHRTPTGVAGIRRLMREKRLADA